MKYEHLNRYLSTEKQKNFEGNFFLNIAEYEVWDEVEIVKEYEAERKFDVKSEDIKAYSEAIMDPNLTTSNMQTPYREFPLLCSDRLLLR